MSTKKLREPGVFKKLERHVVILAIISFAKNSTVMEGTLE